MALTINKNRSATSQEFLPIKEIRDGIVMLKDGGLRMVLLVTSLNFALKGADEQQALLLQFQSFLNATDFSLQFFVESRRLDIKPYLATLDERLHLETNDLIRIQITEYRNFIKSLTENSDIMNKLFFVVVPYTPPIFEAKKGLLKNLLPGGRSSASQQNQRDTATSNFNEQRTQLEQRVEVVRSGLESLGLKSEVLGTEELVELYFKMFNPGESGVPTA